MAINSYILIAYAIFLLITLLINLLYFFQVFKYRLPGDASLQVLAVHVILVLTIIIGTTILVS